VPRRRALPAPYLSGMNEIEDIDVFVSGGGVAGLTVRPSPSQAGFRTVCADPAPPITERDTEGADLRTTAFLQPAQAFLDRIGLWDRLAPHAMPLQVMRIVDAGGEVPEPRVAHDFNAADISDKPFGWNLPNWLLRREMVAHLDPAQRGFPFRHRHGKRPDP
jgi:2-octaprenyl-6-methoxyphenol hydroxylase